MAIIKTIDNTDKHVDLNLDLKSLIFKKKPYLAFTKYIESKMEKYNFYFANLMASIFVKCDLSYSKFINANLEKVIFNKCNLEGVDFTNAFFEDTKMTNCLINKAQFPLFSEYSLSWYIEGKDTDTFEDITLDKIRIRIGCKHKTIKQWDYYFSNECLTTYYIKRDTIEFKRVKAHYKAFKVYLEEMYSEGV